MDRTIQSYESMMGHIYELQQLAELQIQGFQKMREERKATLEELKKTRAPDSIFSMAEGDDVEGSTRTQYHLLTSPSVRTSIQGLRPQLSLNCRSRLKSLLLGLLGKSGLVFPKLTNVLFI